LRELAAAVEADSEHPMARAIVRAAQARMVAGTSRGPVASEFRSLTGRGVQAQVDGATVAIGGPALLRETGAQVPDELRLATEEWVKRGAAMLHVLRDGQVLGAVALEDEIREESPPGRRGAAHPGIRVALITGDSHQVAEGVARELGIDEVFAEVLPQDKDSKVTALQDRGHRVAMVGDGVNDAPALLAWATGYNLVTVPLAAGVLASAGLSVSPAVGAVLMSTSTIVVALNAQLLRRLDLDPAQLAGT
jgi:Cu2+-exporting ATPase